MTHLRIVHAADQHVEVLWGELPLARYVYRPDVPQLESPKPYLHPVRTLAGDVVTAYRPPDHVWHKGIQFALPHVGTENFWGGPRGCAGPATSSSTTTARWTTSSSRRWRRRASAR